MITVLNFPMGLISPNFDSHTDLQDDPVFELYGSTCLSFYMIYGTKCVYWFSDPVAIKKVMSEKTLFQKDLSKVSSCQCPHSCISDYLLC